MSLDHGHLAPGAASLLSRTDSDRIAAIREERWITYPRARLSLELLDDLLARPRTTRMPSLAVYADSGMGKTMLMERFRRAHPQSTIEESVASSLRCSPFKWRATRRSGGSMATS